MNNTNNQNLILSELLQVCTPAPWQVNFFDGNQISDADGESRGCSPIAKTFGGKKEKASNAKLIALAPTIAAELIKERALNEKLLEALKDLFGQVMQAKKGFGIYDSSPSMDTSICTAEAAIKQAEEL